MRIVQLVKTDTMGALLNAPLLMVCLLIGTPQSQAAEPTNTTGGGQSSTSPPAIKPGATSHEQTEPTLSTQETAPGQALTTPVPKKKNRNVDAQPVDKIIAIVDDNIITEHELNQRLNEVRLQLRQNNTPEPPSEILKEQVLSHVILEDIQLQMASLMGIRVDDNSVNESITKIAGQNKMTPEEFREALLSEGVSYKTLREQVRRQMIITQLQRRRIGNRVKITEQDIQNFLASDLGKTNMAPSYNLSHILISPSQGASPDNPEQARELSESVYEELKNGADFSETAVRYSSGPKTLEGGHLGWKKVTQLPEIFTDELLKMKAGDISKPISSPNGYHIIKVNEIRGGTQRHVEQTKVRHILIKPNEIRSDEDAKSLIEDIRVRIINDKNSFGDLAKTYSDDPGSALSGGDLGWVNPGVMVPEFEQVMDESKVTVISEPFHSQFGWHILEVEGRRDRDMSDEYKRNQAHKILYRRKFDVELSSWLREIRQDSYVEIKP